MTHARASLIGIVVAASGCSATKVTADPCTDSAQCRAAFGMGSVCGSKGFCRSAAPEPRCDASEPEDLLDDLGAYSNAVIIGSLHDRSLMTQQARERAVRMVVRQANEKGGLGPEGEPDRPQLGVVFCTLERNETYDDLEPSDACRVASEYLVDVIGVPAIVGPSASDYVRTVFEHIDGSGTLIMSQAATSTVLTDIDAQGLLWRTAPPDSLQGAAIARDAVERGIGDVYVVHAEGAYGGGLSEVFQESFGALGGAAQSRSFQGGVGSERSDAITFAGNEPGVEEILLAAQTTDLIALFGTAAVNPQLFADKSFFVTDAAANEDFLHGADDTFFDAVRGSRPAPLDTSDPVYLSFTTQYEENFDDDPDDSSFLAHTYDAAWLVLYGIAWAHYQVDGPITGTGIAEGLRHVSSGERVEILVGSWFGVIDAFQQGRSIDVYGASGSLDYDPQTEELAAPIEVWSIGPDKTIVSQRLWTP